VYVPHISILNKKWFIRFLRICRFDGLEMTKMKDRKVHSVIPALETEKGKDNMFTQEGVRLRARARNKTNGYL
jgi:hypothetical protein